MNRRTKAKLIDALYSKIIDYALAYDWNSIEERKIAKDWEAAIDKLEQLVSAKQLEEDIKFYEYVTGYTYERNN